VEWLVWWLFGQVWSNSNSLPDGTSCTILSRLL
jgi:hypothetical protein